MRFDVEEQERWKPLQEVNERFDVCLSPFACESLSWWMPAASMPLVVEAIREKSLMHIAGTRQRDVASTDQHQSEITGTREFSFKIKR